MPRIHSSEIRRSGHGRDLEPEGLQAIGPASGVVRLLGVCIPRKIQTVPVESVPVA
jgi:hypothetical protein